MPPLDPAATAAICAHMNDDHADAIVAYAHHYAGATTVTQATMLSLDTQGMDLATNGPDPTIRITFDHELKDAADARDTLIAMAQKASPKRSIAH